MENLSDKIVNESKVFEKITYHKEDKFYISQIYSEFEKVKAVLDRYGLKGYVYSGYTFLNDIDVKIVPDDDFGVLSEFYVSNLSPERAHSFEVTAYHDKDLSKCGCKRYLSNPLDRYNTLVGLMSDAVVKGLAMDAVPLYPDEYKKRISEFDSMFVLNYAKYYEEYAFNKGNLEEGIDFVLIDGKTVYVSDTVYTEVYVMDKMAYVYAKFYMLPVISNAFVVLK